MKLTMNDFNKQVKVYDFELVSLEETWNKESEKTKYQMKQGDIFRTIDVDGNIEYYWYQSLSMFNEATEIIEEYLKENEFDSIDKVDLENEFLFYYGEECHFFDGEHSDDGFLWSGIESPNLERFKNKKIELVHIYDTSVKDVFVEEWKDKTIIHSSIRNYESKGKLGVRTDVDGVFVGDVYRVVDLQDEIEWEHGYDDDKHNRCAVIKEDGEFILKSYYNEYLVKDVFEDDKEFFKVEKLQNYKNFTDYDCCWIGEDYCLE